MESILPKHELKEVWSDLLGHSAIHKEAPRLHIDPITININAGSSSETTILNVLRDLAAKLDLIFNKENSLSAQLDALTAQVASNGTVIGSAIVLLQGLKAALDAAGTDPVALKALSDSLGTQDQSLADAVAANTPVVVA